MFTNTHVARFCRWSTPALLDEIKAVDAMLSTRDDLDRDTEAALQWDRQACLDILSHRGVVVEAWVR